jgi:hypothetical protein
MTDQRKTVAEAVTYVPEQIIVRDRIQMFDLSKTRDRVPACPVLANRNLMNPASRREVEVRVRLGQLNKKWTAMVGSERVHAIG